MALAWITRTFGLTLKVPTAGSTGWATGLLADFVDKISAHDHTGSGKGLQIGNSAIATGAISAAKLATDAVETAKIKDAQVTAAKLHADLAPILFADFTDVVAYNAAELIVGAKGITTSNHISGGVIAPKAGKVKRLQLTAVGSSPSQNCQTIAKVYKNGSYTSVTATVTCTNNSSLVTSGVNCDISLATGDCVSVTLTGGGASGGNTVAIALGVT